MLLVVPYIGKWSSPPSSSSSSSSIRGTLVLWAITRSSPTRPLSTLPYPLGPTSISAASSERGICGLEKHSLFYPLDGRALQLYPTPLAENEFWTGQDCSSVIREIKISAICVANFVRSAPVLKVEPAPAFGTLTPAVANTFSL